MKKLFILLMLLPFVSFGQSSDATLTTSANTIRNETTPGANTALRVGNMFNAIISSKFSRVDDAGLASLENLSTTGIIVQTVANTMAARTLQAGNGMTVTNGDGVSGNPSYSWGGTVTSDVSVTGDYGFYHRANNFRRDTYSGGYFRYKEGMTEDSVFRQVSFPGVDPSINIVEVFEQYGAYVLKADLGGEGGYEDFIRVGGFDRTYIGHSGNYIDISPLSVDVSNKFGYTSAQGLFVGENPLTSGIGIHYDGIRLDTSKIGSQVNYPYLLIGYGNTGGGQTYEPLMHGNFNDHLADSLHSFLSTQRDSTIATMRFLMAATDSSRAAYATNSAIIGGSNNLITSDPGDWRNPSFGDLTNVVVLAGDSVIATQSNTVYVPKLRIGQGHNAEIEELDTVVHLVGRRHSDGELVLKNIYPDILDKVSVSTASGTIDLDTDGKKQRVFTGSSSFATAKNLTISNETSSTAAFVFTFEITNLAAVLTMETNVLMQDSRFDGDDWTATATGVYKMTGTYDGTNWLCEISANPYQ